MAGINLPALLSVVNNNSDDCLMADAMTVD